MFIDKPIKTAQNLNTNAYFMVMEFQMENDTNILDSQDTNKLQI